ncbi:MAG: ribosome silencing factor [Candidatus Melainabacteria bacterium RIFOXYA12_FULL_32_12]|nr:MAG: ribosome silencing factor [Candidatus Melainabacteria bacterium RIFOXYA2_FULL_32_9]OGI28873.1 MAG: ribosome silencing factor [Candidatus Melainabacteria bacterium RIFOXYA12_FULL_32_12]
MMDNKLAKDIVILDISNVSIMADYFVICSAETTTQVRALSSSIREKVKELFGRIPAGDESDARNRWNLLDYGDVIVHVLHREEREFYAIEKFWSHACTIDEETWMKESEDMKDQLR